MDLSTFFQKFDQFADAPDAVAKLRELVLGITVDNPACPRVPLNEITQKITDGTHQTPRYVSAGVPFISIKDFSGGQLDFSATRFISPEEHAMLYKRCDPKRGDILIGRIGTLGKAVIVDTDMEFSLFVSAALIRPNPKYIESAFLRFVLNSPGTKQQFDEIKVGGATHTNKLNLGDLKTLLIPTPPLADQKRIVAKMDELMALCDRLEAQQQERETRHAALAHASLARFAEAPTPANLEWIFHPSYVIPPADLRKAILTLAVQGHLSAGSSDPAEWSTVTMKEVCDLITDGEHATPQRIPSGVPLATAKNVRDGFLDMAHTDYVAPETAEKCWKRCKPKHGDILMVCVGATTGRVCLVINPPDMVLVRSVALLRPSTKRIEGTFLDLFLRSPSGQTQIWGGVRQNAQPCLYLGKMSAFTIQLPPLSEQRRIVAKVDQLMALVDALETQLAAGRATAANLLSALVAELTGTPNDGKASQRSASPTGRRGRPRKSS